MNREAMIEPVLTTQAMNRILNRLRKVGDRATEIAMLHKATELNWLTVYPLKADELPERSESDREAEPPRRRYVGKRIIDGQEVDVYE